MATLNVASKANKAVTLPAVLVTQYAKESVPNASININFEEIDNLKSGDEATVELVQGTETSKYGTVQVIKSLLEVYPFLQGKDVELVKSMQGRSIFCVTLTQW